MTTNYKIVYTDAEIAAADLDNRIALLLSTRAGTIPLDREFGLEMSYVDMPTETVKSLYTAEIIKKVAQYTPEVRVESVIWATDSGGKITAKVVITSA